MKRFSYLRVILVVTLVSLAISWYTHTPAVQPVHASTPSLNDNRIPGEIILLGLLGLITVTTGIPAILLGGVFTGRVVSHPHFFNVFWADNWDNINDTGFHTSDINNATQQIVNSNYFDGASQYGVGSTTFDGSHVASACGSPPGSASFLGIWGYISCEVQLPGSGVPFPNTDDSGNSIYNVWLPRDTDIGNHCQDFAAYHFMSAALTFKFVFPSPIPIPVVQQYAFTALPVTCAKGSFDQLTALASHEMIEAATDPNFGAGFIDLSTFDFGAIDHIAKAGEAADICEPGTGAAPAPSVRLKDGTMVDPYWSNSASACFPATHTVSLKETGLPSTGKVTVTGAAINGDSNPHVLSLPFKQQVIDGATFSFSYPTPVAGSSGVRYVTSDTGQSVTLTSDLTDTAAYSEEDFLTTNTNVGPPAPPSLTMSDWHAHGSTVNLTTDALVSAPPDRWRFDHWSSNVANIATPSTSIVMAGPQTATANYVLQHQLTFDQTGIPGFPWTVTVDGVSQAGPYSTWFDHGTSHSFSYQTPVPGNAGTRYVLTGTSESTPLTATSTRTVTGTYKTQHLLTVNTHGMPSPNLTHITNSSVILGTANDITPLALYLDHGTVLALGADANVNGAGGTQYFDQGYQPLAPPTLLAPFTTTVKYETISQIISDLLGSGALHGLGARSMATALNLAWNNVQTHMAIGHYSQALFDVNGFFTLVKAQSGKMLTVASAKTLMLDGSLVYHNAMCKALVAGQITSGMAASDYTYYKQIVQGAGGVPLGPC